MLVCAGTGFSSGLPLYVLIQMIPAWLRGEGVDLKTIGFFSILSLPYTWKFMWSPLLDRYTLPLLGRRRGWALFTQIALLLALGAFSLLDPEIDVKSIAILTGIVAFFSASQDIVLDAYRRELLEDRELGIGNSYYVNAYRLAGLVPGSLALILADSMSWEAIHWIVGGFMGIGIICTLLMPEPEFSGGAPKSFQSAVIEPFREFFSRKGFRHALLILSFILLYKLGDSMATALATPFYIDLGHSMSVIGSVAKVAGLWATIFGAFVGGAIMLKIGINKSLWAFGVVQVVTILGFAVLSNESKTLPFLDHQRKAHIDDIAQLEFIQELSADQQETLSHYFGIESVPSNCGPSETECKIKWIEQPPIAINVLSPGRLQKAGFSETAAKAIETFRTEKDGPWIRDADTLNTIIGESGSNSTGMKLSFKIQANTDDKDILSRHPAISDEMADSIASCRESVFLLKAEDLSNKCKLPISADNMKNLENDLRFQINPNTATGQDLGQIPGLQPSLWLLFIVVSLEYLGVGLGTAAFVAFMASITDKRYTATQYALLTSIMALPRTLASASSGYLIESIGYTPFFFICFIIALPGMALLFWVAPWGEKGRDKAA